MAALLHASWNAIIKSGGNSLFETTLNTIGGGLTALCILVFALFIPGIFPTFFAPFAPFISLPSVESLPFLLGSIGINFVYYLCIATAYKYGDFSYTYTIMRGSAPMFTAIMLAFLGQDMPLLGWLAVIFISCGVLTLTLDAIRKGRFHLQSTLIAFSTALVIMSYTVLDGYGSRASNSPIGYVCLLFFFSAFPMTILVYSRHKKDFINYCKRRAGIGVFGVFGGFCNFASYGIAVWAMTKAPIALVAALRETSVIFAMLLAVLFLKERLTLARVIAIVLVMTGLFCMRLG